MDRADESEMIRVPVRHDHAEDGRVAHLQTIDSR
jgi:hypothetical protein